MIRAQRRFHAFLWPVLAVALCAIIGAALLTRARVDGVVAAAPYARPS